MAYIVGILSPDEEATLTRRGWEVEAAPKDLVPEDERTPEQCARYRMVWVDQSMFDIMSGPDWDTDEDTEGYTRDKNLSNKENEQACKESGFHLTLVDDDGYCEYCGNQPD